jgi:phenylacetate-CoA ligase
MTPRQLTLLRDLRPDILACTPSYAIRLGEAFAEAGTAPGDIGLTAGLFGAEPWSEPMRARIEQLLGLRALDIYGLSEVIGPGVAAECLTARDGLHVNEDHFLVEVVDPATGTPGELVFSTLTRQALPLLRYRSGDVAALRRGRCACGRTLARMSKVSGRSDDMLVLRGVNVYPAEVERVLLADGRVSPHYLLVVDARTAVKDLIVAVESLTANAARGDLDGPLARELEDAVRGELGVRTRVRVLAAGAVPRTEIGKAVRVVTWAGGDPPLAGLAGP